MIEPLLPAPVAVPLPAMAVASGDGAAFLDVLTEFEPGTTEDPASDDSEAGRETGLLCVPLPCPIPTELPPASEAAVPEATFEGGCRVAHAEWGAEAAHRVPLSQGALPPAADAKPEAPAMPEGTADTPLPDRAAAPSQVSEKMPTGPVLPAHGPAPTPLRIAPDAAPQKMVAPDLAEAAERALPSPERPHGLPEPHRHSPIAAAADPASEGPTQMTDGTPAAALDFAQAMPVSHPPLMRIGNLVHGYLRQESVPVTHAPQGVERAAEPVMIVARSSEGGADQIEIRLDPEELGQLRIALTRDGDTLRVLVQVERGETLDLMRRHADTLARELHQAGFSGAEMSFGQWSQHAPPSQAAVETPEMADPPNAAPHPSYLSSHPAAMPVMAGLNIRI